MGESNLKCRVWAIGIYLYTTNVKGVSSMRLHRELGIGQKTVWFMLHRLRNAAKTGGVEFYGPITADETYIGGKHRNMSNSKRKALKNMGRGAVQKTPVVGITDRETNKKTLQGFVEDNTDPDTKSIPMAQRPTTTFPGPMRASTIAFQSM